MIEKSPSLKNGENWEKIERGFILPGKKEQKFHQKLSHPDIISDDEDNFDYENKSKVECICPKCGKKHIMNFHWIGRGVPRKFCKLCRTNELADI